MEQTMDTIFKNPCILTQIASILDISKFNIIKSSERIGFERTLSECKDNIRGNIVKAITVIQGDENCYENFKRNLLQFISREIQCYIVLCKMVCSSLILNLAHTLGYASRSYVWIAIGQPAFKNKMKYPKTWLSISITQNEMSSTQLSKSNINPQVKHIDLRRRAKK